MTGTEIDVPGFTVRDFDGSDVRFWTADDQWGLVFDGEDEDGNALLVLLDSDGMPSNHKLTEDHARHITASAGLGADLMSRWDYYASAI
jgi:hypothetical protein